MLHNLAKLKGLVARKLFVLLKHSIAYFFSFLVTFVNGLLIAFVVNCMMFSAYTFLPHDVLFANPFFQNNSKSLF